MNPQEIAAALRQKARAEAKAARLEARAAELRKTAHRSNRQLAAWERASMAAREWRGIANDPRWGVTPLV